MASKRQINTYYMFSDLTEFITSDFYNNMTGLENNHKFGRRPFSNFSVLLQSIRIRLIAFNRSQQWLPIER